MLHTGQPERLLPDVDPHGHGAQVASTGGSVVQTLQTGQPERLFPEVEPHGQSAHVGSGLASAIFTVSSNESAGDEAPLATNPHETPL
jgi:hypothetical protein